MRISKVFTLRVNPFDTEYQKVPSSVVTFPLRMHRQNLSIVPGGHVFNQNLFCTERSVKCLAFFLHFVRCCLESIKGTSWSLLGPGEEVGLTPSFIDYVGLSLK